MREATICETAIGGSWRGGAFIRWTDFLSIIEAFLVWLGLVVVVMTVALAAKGAGSQSLPGDIQALANTPMFFYGISASLYLVLGVYFWRIARRVSDEALVARFRPLPWQIFLGTLLAGAVCAIVVPLATYYLTQHDVAVQSTKAELRMLPRNSAEWLAAVAVIGGIGPLVEELFFRGILLGWLKRKMPLLLAVVVSGVIFGLIHLNFISHAGLGGWYITGVVSLFGILAAVIAVKTGSLWASFGLHAAYNATLISLPMLASVLPGVFIP